jgi:hypothetical protein
LGCNDPRLDKAFEWMLRSVSGEGLAPASDVKAPMRYYAYTCGPEFVCGANNKRPCAWGAVKIMMALGTLSKEEYTPLVEKVISLGANFLLSIDPATAAYPARYDNKPSRDWWKFGFPVFYITDLLQLSESLLRLGYGADPRLAQVLKLIREQQDETGRWRLDYDYNEKTWIHFGVSKEPNKWVTLRALRVLKAAGE